jgi:hypothetical protein
MLHEINVTTMKRYFALPEESWEQVERESKRLGISSADFLRMLTKQYFNGIKFEREYGEKGS